MEEQPPQPPQPSSPESQNPQTPHSQPKPESEQLEFLRREEVRTMKKDIATLRERETQEEREKIARLKAEREALEEQEMVKKVREMALARKMEEEKKREAEAKRMRESLLPPDAEKQPLQLPKAPPPMRKFLVRVIVVLVLAFGIFNLVMAGYWYLRTKGIISELPIPPISIEIPSIRIPSITLPKIDFSSLREKFSLKIFKKPQPSFLPEPQPQQIQPALSDPLGAQYTVTLQFQTRDELLELYSQVVKENQNEGVTHMILKKRAEEDVISPKEFFDIFEIQVPEALQSELQNPGAFFVYRYERGNRWGFVVPISDAEKLTNELRLWEETMEENFQPLSSLLGTQGEWFIHSFVGRAYRDTEIRFQTFSLRDIGIVYAILDNYLIFSNSFEATKALIDRIGSLDTSGGSSMSEKEISSLPLARALGQLFLIGFEDAALTPKLQELLNHIHPGGVIVYARNAKSPAQLKELLASLQSFALTQSSLPLFVAIDQEGGPVTRLKFASENTGQYEIRSSESAYLTGKIRGQELKNLGINLNLAPVLDETRPSDFLYNRTFQVAPTKAGTLATALIEGYRDAGVLVAPKHFPGYTGVTFNPDKKLAVVRDFPDFSAFVTVLKEQPPFLMIANVIYPVLNSEVPFVFSPEGITFIRSILGFEGIVLSDDLAQPVLLDNYAFRDVATAPLLAGVDMLIVSKEDVARKIFDELIKEAERNPELRAQIYESAERIVELKKSFFAEESPEFLVRKNK